MYEVKQAGPKGLGVFATRNIEKGTRIMADEPVFLLAADEPPCDPIEIYDKFRSVDRATRKQCLQLTCSSDRAKLSKLRKTALASNTYASKKFSQHRIDEAVKLAAIFDVNAFEITDKRWSGGKRCAIFLQATRFNHSCLPNAGNGWEPNVGKLSIHAVKEIRAGEEITISYIDPRQRREVRMQGLWDMYEFECTCVACAINLGTVSGRQSVERRLEMEGICRKLEKARRTHDFALKRANYIPDLQKLIRLVEEEELVGPWMVDM